MAGTKTYQIKPGGGGHFTSLVAWELDRNNTLGSGPNLVANNEVVIAEVYGGASVGGVYVQKANWTTDATHYVQIRAAVGHENGGILDVTKAYISGSVSTEVFGTIGPGLSVAGAITIEYADTNTNITIERNVARTNGNYIILSRAGGNGATRHIFKNNILIGFGGSVTNIQMAGGKALAYNNTIVATGFTGILGQSSVITSQNNYISQAGAASCYYYSGVSGSNDATSNTEALTPSLRSIAYSTANFVNVTAGSENLHLKTGSALLLKGATLSGVTNDIDGTSRVGYIFDIGADQFDQVPFCWNYTARYRNSSKLFKASGCGDYPKTLRVPNNIDKSTGRMIDDGIEIDPSEYQII